MIYPSVTQVLSVYQDFSMVPEHILMMAADRGSRVHAICASLAQKLFVSHRQITPDIEGYIQSFNQWLEYVDEVVIVEKELMDPHLGFVGHPDLVVKMKGNQHLTLIDLKTPKIIGKTWRAQLAAYWHLTAFFLLEHKLKIKHCGSLRLKQDGGLPIFDEYTDTRHADFTAFLSALNAWRYFNNGGN